MDRLHKAFDSVPHSWMIKCMQLHKINPPNNQTDRESNGVMENHIDITELGRKDQNTGGEDKSRDLPGRQPFTPPVLPGPGPTEQTH